MRKVGGWGISSLSWCCKLVICMLQYCEAAMSACRPTVVRQNFTLRIRCPWTHCTLLHLRLLEKKMQSSRSQEILHQSKRNRLLIRRTRKRENSMPFGTQAHLKHYSNDTLLACWNKQWWWHQTALFRWGHITHKQSQDACWTTDKNVNPWHRWSCRVHKADSQVSVPRHFSV